MENPQTAMNTKTEKTKVFDTKPKNRYKNSQNRKTKNPNAPLKYHWAPSGPLGTHLSL